MGLATDKNRWTAGVYFFKKYYKIVTFDNRGVGESDKPAGPYTTKMMADDTVGLMDHLGIKKANILGVSMGGMIALEIAINYPEKVSKLVLGCTFACDDGALNGETEE
jgi:pimeloyl-ACP methyl ester carboxylesterase